MVPVGEGARGRVSSEIGAQPYLLGRAGAAATDLRAVGVDHHDMPGSQVVTVVALDGIAGRATEIAKVAGGASGPILMIPNRGAGAVLVATPARRVAGGELLRGPSLVDVVTKGRDRATETIEQSG